MSLKVRTIFVFVAGLFILGCSPQELPRFKNKYYYHQKGWLDGGWFGARRACKSRNMELLKIESAEENNFVNQVLRKGLNMVGYEGFCWWTAGTKFVEMGTFYWSNTGTFINYFNWEEISYANDTGYDFIAVTTWSYNDALTWKAYWGAFPCYLVCEKTVDFP